MKVLVHMLCLFVYVGKFRRVNTITVNFLTSADTLICSRKVTNANP